MQRVVAEITSVFDQLNPFNTGNLILFFGWLAVFTFTTVAVWRCPLPWFRFLCFVVNQLFSIGILLSWTLTVLLAVTYWRESLLVLAGTGIGSFWLFRRRRPRVPAGVAPDQVRDGRRPAGLPPSRLDADDEPL
jgi:hypothetical protein